MVGEQVFIIHGAGDLQIFVEDVYRRCFTGRAGILFQVCAFHRINGMSVDCV